MPLGVDRLQHPATGTTLTAPRQTSSESQQPGGGEYQSDNPSTAHSEASIAATHAAPRPLSAIIRPAMPRRWVAALILASGIILLAVGTAVGYWAIPEARSAADCEAAINYYKTIDESIALRGWLGGAADQMVDACHPGGLPDYSAPE